MANKITSIFFENYFTKDLNQLKKNSKYSKINSKKIKF